jgi:hypothetical protein
LSRRSGHLLLTTRSRLHHLLRLRAKLLNL